MTFKDQAWVDRFSALGDEAERVFETVAKNVLGRGFTRYGLNRPPIQMHKLPENIRYTPDYLMSDRLVECQGFGRDQTFKLKADKLRALHFWHYVFPVEFFVWNTTKKEWCFIELEALDDLDYEIASFPEGKRYYAFEADDIFAKAHTSGPFLVANA